MKIYFLIFFKIFFILFFNFLYSQELKNSFEERKTDTYAFLQDFIKSDLIFISSLGQNALKNFSGFSDLNERKFSFEIIDNFPKPRTTSEMKCLEEAIIQGAIDPIEEDDYSDMPELMSPELISFTDELEELDYPFVINETVENNINEIEEESTNEIEEENTNVIEINSINEIEINSINERNNSINERNNSLDFQFNLHGEGIRLERSLLEEFTNAIENSLDLDTERTRAVQNEIILDRNLIDDFTNAIENNLELEIERTRVERNENRLES